MKLIDWLVFCFVSLTWFILVGACTRAEKQAAKTALDIADTLCVIANAGFSDAKVQEVCAVEHALMPDVKRLLDAHRKKMAATRCVGADADAAAPVRAPADGGAP